jgi:hypothetical protein
MTMTYSRVLTLNSHNIFQPYSISSSAFPLPGQGFLSVIFYSGWAEIFDFVLANNFQLDIAYKRTSDFFDLKHFHPGYIKTINNYTI